MRGLQWQTRFVPLAYGLNQQMDDRALAPPSLAIAKDLEFEETGGLQTRKPFGSTMTAIDGGGSLSNCRRIYRNGDELVLFTKDTMYTRNATASTWMNRGTHLAVKVEEEPRFITTDDQIECDRAELNGIVVYAWSTTLPNQIYVAAVDKTTGAVTLAPTLTSTGNARPRLVALTTKILLFVASGANGLVCWAIDPAAPGAAIVGAATTVLAAASFNLYYDAVKIAGADTAAVAMRRAVTTSYELAKVTAGLTVTNSTKARTCDGPIAISSDPTGATLQVIRGNGTNIQGDRITTSSLADAATGQAVGTCTGTLFQIAAAHRSVLDSGQYRCYAFWHSAEAADATDWQSRFNFVDTGGTIGTEATFIRRLAVASRAFDHDGRVYVWGVFAGESTFSGANKPDFHAQLQNTYFLYRDDATLVSKSTFANAGGFNPSKSFLPGVALVSGTTQYAWCATERRIIPLGDQTTGGQSGYADRGPRDVLFTFDSNEARRCVRLGRTLYITGGEILQYDGEKLTEVGFHVYPWYFGIIEVGTGNLANGTYAFKLTWRWDSATGELDRSTTATVGTLTIAGGPNGAEFPSLDIIPLYVTRKTVKAPAVEIWRTPVNPTADAPFYLVTAKDPADTSNPNRYLANDTTVSGLAVFDDEFADSTLTTKESNPENDGIIPSLAPPGATIIAASDTRIFLAGVPGDPHRVWYSKLRNDGEIAAFHGARAFDVPPAGGDITGLAVIDEQIVVFRETAVYVFGGEGFSNAIGVGSNYGPPRVVANDVGAVSAEAIGIIPQGILFKSSKGWQFLDRSLAVRYVGGAVVDSDSETVVAVHATETLHQIRCLTTARMLVWDYQALTTQTVGPGSAQSLNVGQWSEWTLFDGLHAAVWQGNYLYLTSTGPKQQATNYTGVAYGQVVETAWIDVTDRQGRGALRAVEILGEFRSGCFIRVQIARDFIEGDDDQSRYNWVHDEVIDPNTGEQGGSPGDPLGLRVTPKMQTFSAFKIKLTVMGDASAQGTLATGNGGASWGSGGNVTTSGSAWSATLRAREPGTIGEAIGIQIYTSAGPDGVEVRDGEIFDGTSWIVVGDPRTVGVRVGGAMTVLQLEQAINDGSRLLEVSVADVSPTKIISDTNTLHVSLGMAGGTDQAADGESVKLTGLSLELGYKQGLNKRVPARQQW